MFLWHFPSGCPDRTLSCTLPAEARTFLTRVGAAIERAPPPLTIAQATVRVVEARRLELLTLTLPA
jgi:hypothetical protein